MKLLLRTSKIIIWKVWFKSFLSMTFSFRIQMYRCRQVDFLMLISIKLCQKCWKIFCKNFNIVKFKCNLLPLRCLLESILSLCEMNGTFLSAHINTKRLLTSVALLLRLSKWGTVPDTITEFSLLFNYLVKSMIYFAIWLIIFPVRRSLFLACK